jgi:S-adenosylmethionine:tRNA-ribosyltransferase-isomerase (queuine synthetase)
MLENFTYNISDFDYDLPQELIAQTPIEPRDASRLLVVHRDSGKFEHRHFRDIGVYLRPGDLLIANQSRVLPARLLGHRSGTGGAVEVLLLSERSDLGLDYWETLVRPGRRLREGSRIVFGDETGNEAETQQGAFLQAEVLERTEAGGRIVRFTVENMSLSMLERGRGTRAEARTRAEASPAPTIHETRNPLPLYSRGVPLRSPSGWGGDPATDGGDDLATDGADDLATDINSKGSGTWAIQAHTPSPSYSRGVPLRSPSGSDGGPSVTVRELIEQLGCMPLPPYIHEKLRDPERYQTVYARITGSAAAPTAGLHFTPHLLEQLRQQGVQVGFVTLHVGLDTFRPIECEDIREHKMHSEETDLDAPTAELINETRHAGGRVVAVGTTAVRVLESVASFHEGRIEPYHGATRLFITPGFRFQVVDAMITNFHLPRSTLLLLVSAFASKTLIEEAYQEAIRERYRFYSFGDAMLIL